MVYIPFLSGKGAGFAVQSLDLRKVDGALCAPYTSTGGERNAGIAGHVKNLFSDFQSVARVARSFFVGIRPAGGD
jgi:hypothetical protein